MQLHIANATKQDHDFLYRIKGTQKTNLLPIKKGGQVSISGDREELEDIVAQHRVYGIVDVKDFSKALKFSGMIYSFSGPINVDRIYEALERHDDVIDETAQLVREQSAAATNAAIEEHAGSSNSKVEATSFELKELPKDQTDTSPKVDVVVRADKKADPKPQRSARRPRNEH